MTDLPTPDPAVQPCTGPDGHVPSADDGRYYLPPYRFAARGYPDLIFLALGAAEGYPCLKRFYRAPGSDPSGPAAIHVHAVALVPADDPLGGSALIEARRDRTGHIRIVQNLDHLTSERRRHVRAAWRVGFGELHRFVGRQPADRGGHIEDLHANYIRLKPLCARQGHSTAYHPTHSECLEGTGVSLQASHERLRLAGWTWTKLRALWERGDTGNYGQQRVPNNSE